MNYTQNEKIEQVTDSTMVVGVDIGSQIHYARAFDNRGRELTKRIFSFHYFLIYRYPASLFPLGRMYTRFVAYMS